MHPHQFDALARLASGPMPRRRSVLALAGAVLTSTAAFGAAPVAAGCNKVGRKCDKNKDCCDGARCKGGKKGKCRCKNGFRECSSKCFDLDKDEKHCGDCDTTCGATETCCSGECADLQTSNAHCGACNTICPEGAGCVEGVCFDP